MKVTSKVYNKTLKSIDNKAIDALVQTAYALKSDVQHSQTMPFDTGALENRSTFVDESNKNRGEVGVVTDTPYARYQYYGINRFKEGEKLKHKTDKNKNAGPFWFQPYINGDKKDFATKTFAKIMRGKMK